MVDTQRFAIWHSSDWPTNINQPAPVPPALTTVDTKRFAILQPSDRPTNVNQPVPVPPALTMVDTQRFAIWHPSDRPTNVNQPVPVPPALTTVDTQRFAIWHPSGRPTNVSRPAPVLPALTMVDTRGFAIWHPLNLLTNVNKPAPVPTIPELPQTPDKSVKNAIKDSKWNDGFGSARSSPDPTLRPLAPSELCSASTPHVRPVETETHTREDKVSLLDDRSNILNKDTVEASSEKQLFTTVGAALALVRVGVPIPHLPVDSHRHPNQDNMLNDQDSVQLSEYCFNTREVLRNATQGRDADGVEESVRGALKDLERCRFISFCLFPYRETPGSHSKSSGLS